MSNNTIDAKRYILWTPPPPVGYWILPGSTSVSSIKFSMLTKPNWLHRKMMQWLMGWKWENNNES